MALVSVIIPAYNQAGYLAQAIRSVLDQTFRDFEIIVVDDGSTDKTPEVARWIRDRRLRYVRQENRGLSAARNTGIRESAGEYLTFLDSDDLFLPEKLELLLGALETRPEAGIAAGQAIPIDEDGNPVGRIFDKPLPEDPTRLLLENPLHVGSVLLRRSWRERVGFFDETLRSYEDWDMWLRLALAGCPSVWVPRPVSKYRFHRAQMTRIGAQMTASTFAVLDKVFSRSDLPERWISARSVAYGRAHLRAAAQAWLARDFRVGADHLGWAVKEDPTLMENDGRDLANHFRAWTDLPKVGRPLEFLEDIYTHLPPELRVLAARRRTDLGRAAAQFAHESYAARDFRAARGYAVRALRYNPSFILNRSLVSILGRSLLNE